MEPLPPALKKINQRLLAEHCMREDRLQALWKTLAEQGHDMGGRGTAQTLSQSIAYCNDQLQSIGLEIVAVSIRSTQTHRYYSMINKFNDTIAKQCFAKLYNSYQHAYIRLVLATLAQQDHGRQSLSRTQLLNLRTQMSDPSKLPLVAAEEVLEYLLEDRWLQVVQVAIGTPGNEDEVGEGNQSQSTSTSSGGTRRGKSSNNNHANRIALAPRSFMELSYLLVDEFGMDKDAMPQILYHRN